MSLIEVLWSKIDRIPHFTRQCYDAHDAQDAQSCIDLATVGSSAAINIRYSEEANVGSH